MRDEIEQRVLEDVKRVGWHLIIVPDDEEGPGFVYSAGFLKTLNHPEVIMFGLDTNLMVDVINGMGNEIRKGRRFAEPGLAEGFLKGYPCKVVSVAKRWHAEYMRYAMWHHEHTRQPGPFKAVQCLWPDEKGRFPDDALCHAEVVERQALLNIP